MKRLTSATRHPNESMTEKRPVEKEKDALSVIDGWESTGVAGRGEGSEARGEVNLSSAYLGSGIRKDKVRE